MARSNRVHAAARAPRASAPRRGRLFDCESLEPRRLLAAGDLDRSFDADGMAAVDLGNGMTLATTDVLVQLDGKTVIVGSSSPGHFRLNGDDDRIIVARLLIDGSLDPSFGPDGSGVVMTTIDADAHGFAATLQNDGRIVVVGTALETSGVNNYQHAVVRYNPDGSPDRSFDGDGVIHVNIGDVASDSGAYDVAVQGDGKIVVAGHFWATEGLGTDSEFSILRLNPDGSYDESFASGGVQVSDFSEPQEPVLGLDYNGTPATNPYYGSIVVAGYDRDRAVVLRLNPDGSFSRELDGDGQLSFKYPGSTFTVARSVLVQPGGKIVVGGYTSGINGNPDFLLARFNPDGTLDPTFGTEGAVLTDFDGREDRATSVIRSYNGDRLMVGGSSDGNFALARYTNDGVLDTAFQSGGKVRTPFPSGATPRLAAGPGRRLTAAGGPHFHAVRYLDDGANLVAVGSFDANGGSETGGEEAHFLVTRSERLPTPLRVYLDVSGTAAPPFFLSGEDYVGVGDNFSLSAFTGGTYVDIPANQTFTSVSIRPTDDTLFEGDETAVFSIAPHPSYEIGTPASTTLELYDNDASTLYAVADAHVIDGTLADLNFGAAAFLETQASAGPVRTRETYLKFDASAFDAVRFSSVWLRVFGRVTGAAPAEVFGVSASGWEEQTITFNNRPAASTAALGEVEVVNWTEQRYTFDVTDFVNREKAAGRNVVTLLLRNAAGAGAARTLWSSRGSEYSDPRLIVTGSIAPPGGTPRVTQVFAGSTAWAPAFRRRLEEAGLGDSAWGYAVGDGTDQLKSLPWGNLDTISVRFTTGVNVAREHLLVRGARGGQYAFSDFTYDPDHFLATWTLARPLGPGGEKVLLDLDGDVGTGVASGFPRSRFLDGEWADGADAYDSGDGTHGGDFRFQVNALRGDVDQNGRVNSADLYALRARLLRHASELFSGARSAYSPLYDLDADGRVGARDVTALRAALFSQVPTAAPAPAAAPPATRRVPPVRQLWWADDAVA